MSLLENVLLRGTRASQPAATAVAEGSLYFVTDEGVTEQSRSGAWVTYTDTGGAGVNFSAGTTSRTVTNIVFSNSNGVSFGLNGSTITGSVAGGGNLNFSAGTTSNNLTNLVFSNSNNVSFGLNGSTVTATATVASTQGSVNLSAGTTSNLSASFVFSNSNGVSFGLNAGTITGSIATSLTNINVSAGTTSNNLSALTFSNANGVSFGLNGSTVTASVAAGGAAGSISAGTTNVALGQVVFSNSNNVSFGLNGSTVTATATVASTQGSIRISAGTTSILSSGFTFSNSNNFTFGMDNGTITASYTVPTVTNSSMTVSDAATSGTLARLAFTNLNGVTLSLSTGAGGSHTIVGSHNGLTSQSNQNVTANNGGFAFQTLSFSNVNNFSFGTSAGSAITGSFSQSNQQMTLFGTSNTTQSSSGTTNASSFIFAGAGGVSVGITNGSVVISGPTGGGADGGVFAGVSTFGNTAGSTGTVSTGNFVLVGSNQISLSQSTGAAGSAATVTILGPAPASTYRNIDYQFTTQSQTAANQSISYVLPLNKVPYLSCTYLGMIQQISFASTTFASTANALYSFNNVLTYNFVLYTRGTGASSLSLRSLVSTSAGLTHSFRGSQNTTNNISVSVGLTYPMSTGTSSTSFSYAATSSSMAFITTGLTALTGIKFMQFPFATSLSAGDYWMAYGISSAVTSESTNASGFRMQFSVYCANQPNNANGIFGESNASSHAIWGIQGLGSFSTAGGGTTGSIPFSAISSSASHLIPYFAFERY